MYASGGMPRHWAQPAARVRLRRGLQEVRDLLRDAEALRAVGKLAHVHLGELEQLFDEVVDLHRLLLDDGQVRPLLFGRIGDAVEQPLDVGADGGQRRAHVVGDAGQQLLPPLLLALELLHGGPQPVGHLVERLADRLEFVPLRVRDPMAEVAVPDLADALGQGRQGLGDVPERDRAMMPAARLTLVSSTSPLGSMPNSPADVATTASYTGSPRRNSASRNSRTPRNGIQ